MYNQLYTVLTIVLGSAGYLVGFSDNTGHSEFTCCHPASQCCVSNDWCCTALLPGARVVATDSSDDLAGNTCCIKRAYCCTVGQRCCPKKRVEDATAQDNSATSVASTSAGSTCCIKRAFCCSTKQTCCANTDAS